jgi:hypothetical protein
MAIRICEVCKALIEPERLEIPDTRLCERHAREIDKYGGEFLTSSHQERTSKAGSLKLNYGGVTTSKRRNVLGIQRLKDEFLGQA